MHLLVKNFDIIKMHGTTIKKIWFLFGFKFKVRMYWTMYRVCRKCSVVRIKYSFVDRSFVVFLFLVHNGMSSNRVKKNYTVIYETNRNISDNTKSANVTSKFEHYTSKVSNFTS